MTIRRVPDDFRVEEVLEDAWRPVAARPAGEAHAVYVLEKTQLTTQEAEARLAKALGVRSGRVTHAGLKDKHAVTRQHVSTKWDGEGEPPESVEAPGVKAMFAGWLARELEAAAIAGNRFEIVVRDLSQQAAKEMQRRFGALKRLAAAGGTELVFVNYFGEQRFASVQPKAGFAGERLVRGDFEGALKLLIGTPARKDSGARRTLTRAAAEHWGEWKRLLRELPKGQWRGPVEKLAAGEDFREAFAALPYAEQMFAVEAYQSWLWNRNAAAAASAAAGKKTLRTPTDFGELVFPAAAEIPDAMMHATLALPGPEARYDGALAKVAQATLAEVGVSLGALKIPGVRRPEFGTAMRPLVVAASGVEFEGPAADEMSRAGRVKVWARFTLPRGAYATVLLRALGQ
ncbi:MAG: tRNA pseudouridine(13) synthase TruD [Tepidisphaera sp.]|nr:tRNA pseudouridine(13) synthase TruD [Tepidisphaera sp.]